MEKAIIQPESLIDTKLNRMNRPAFHRLYMFLLEVQRFQKAGRKFSKTKLAKAFGIKSNFGGDLPDMRNIEINDDFVKSLYVKRSQHRKSSKDGNWKIKDGDSNHFDVAKSRMKDFLSGVKKLQESGVYPIGVRKVMTDCRIGIFPMSIIPDLRNEEIDEELVERMMNIRHEYYKSPKTFSQKYQENKRQSINNNLNMENKLYWIRGCKGNPDGVRKALEDKNIDVTKLPDFDKDSKSNECVICGVPGHRAFKTHIYPDLTQDWDPIADFFGPAGIELQPEPKTEIEEISELDKLQPFDRVVVRDGLANWQVDFFVAIGDSKELGRQYVCIGSSWDECHSYEPWMNKYIGSTTPFDEWKKED